MSEIVGAIVGAAAVVCIPLIAWFSRRATREGRLMLRVERLGTIYALMPDSPERETFKVHVTGAVENLNSWLDSDNLKGRRTIRRITVATYIIGVVGVLISLPFARDSAPWVSSAIGTLVGVAIAGVTFTSSYFVERGARRQAETDALERESAAAAMRMEALRRGESAS